MLEKLYVGHYRRQDNRWRYHLSQNGTASLCGLGPCDALDFLPNLMPVHRVLSNERLTKRRCKTCWQIAHGMLDAITRLGHLIHHEG